MLAWSRWHIAWIVRSMVWCTILKVPQFFSCDLGVSQSHHAIVKLQKSLHFWSLGGFRLLKTKSSQTPFEQWSFHPGWLGYAGDEKLPSYIGIIIDNYKSPYCPTSISWHVTGGFWSLLICFPFFSARDPTNFHRAKQNPPPLHRAPRWFHWQEWPWRIYVTWSWKKCTESGPGRVVDGFWSMVSCSTRMSRWKFPNG